jgi:hypothetical protein
VTGKPIPEHVQRLVRERDAYRCAYCKAEERYVYTTLHIEHIIPVAKGGTDAEDNLCLSCPWCNQSKGSKILDIDSETGEQSSLFNPRQEIWSEHFEWGRQDRSRIVGKTPTGRATVRALKLNRMSALIVRRNWLIAGWHPPADE